MPANMLSFGEWAASQGLETMAPGTWTAYTEYVSAFGKPETKEPYVSPTPPTVTVVNRSQQVRAGALHPAPAYSRVVGLWTGVLPVINDIGQEPTQSLGNNVRLLSIRLRLWTNDTGVHCSGYWYLATGTKLPANAAEVFNQWDALIPNMNNLTKAYRWDGETVDMCWTMNKIFSGSGRRFALWLTNNLATRWWAHAMFEISEG